MKKLAIIILSIVWNLALSNAQPLNNDTIVCIIDTTKSYVEFRKKPFPDRMPDLRWQISVKGHYYDHLPDYKDFPCIVFDSDSLRHVYRKEKFKGPFSFIACKKNIFKKYLIVDDEWINSQNKLHAIKNKIGFAPFEYHNFVIFKTDLEDSTNDLVTLHRVTVGYCEVQF